MTAHELLLVCDEIKKRTARSWLRTTIFRLPSISVFPPLAIVISGRILTRTSCFSSVHAKSYSRTCHLYPRARFFTISHYLIIGGQNVLCILLHLTIQGMHEPSLLSKPSAHGPYANLAHITLTSIGFASRVSSNASRTLRGRVQATINSRSTP
jgi:hypothetical protein